MTRQRGHVLLGLATCLATASGCALFQHSSGSAAPANTTPPGEARPASTNAADRGRVDSTYQVRQPAGTESKAASSSAQNPVFRIATAPSAVDPGAAPNFAGSGATFPTAPTVAQAPASLEQKRNTSSAISLPADHENNVGPLEGNLPGGTVAPNPVPKPAIPVGSGDAKPPLSPQVVLISPPASKELVTSAVPTKEPPLLAFMRFYLDKRPDDAVAQLNCYDKTRQDLLLALLSMATGLTEGDPGKLEPKQVAVVINQLRGIAAKLLSKAPLQLGVAELAKTVEGFGIYAPMPPDHLYSPDDYMLIYVEVQNFSSVFNSGRHEIRLAGSLDFLDAENHLIPNAHIEFPGKNVPVQTVSVVREFYRAYSFSIPKWMKPGKYTLRLQVKDEPTQRVAVHDFNIFIGAPGRQL